MRLYNTATRSLEEVTSEDGLFRMYVCGVTPYDTAHLGHAFTYTCFDVLERYLEHQGYRTLVVQNVTDIDDDILRAAKRRGIPWDELGQREAEKHLHDMKAINVREPDHVPYATQEITRIINMVSDLLNKGYAYEKNGSVYYDTRNDPDFGKHLMQADYNELLSIANERGNYPDDANKRDPLDFVLWQAAQPDEPTWDSPWGPGRPGWHIECSAMSMHYLGDQVDIHCGGSDLIFPHHSCEIVQSERFSGVQPFVRYWFHVAMVELGGEKMSKSLGNMLFVRDLLERYSANAIRYYLLTHKYRVPWGADDADQGITTAQQHLDRWQQALDLPHTTDDNPLDANRYEQGFLACMDDDLSTDGALENLNALADAILNHTDGDVQQAQSTLRTLSDVLGIVLS